VTPAVGLAFLALNIVLLGIGISIPLVLVFTIGTKMWVPEFLRPKKRVISYPGVRYSGIFHPEDVGVALDTFKRLWENLVGPSKEFDKMFKYLDITFLPDVIYLKQPYIIDGKSYDRASGITDSKYSVRVFDQSWTEQKIADGTVQRIPRSHKKLGIYRTALGHELIHVALYHTLNNPDFDHEGEIVKAWHEEHTEVESKWQSELKERGI